MYIKKITRYGNRIEIVKYHTYRYGIKGEKRKKKEKPTNEKVKENNLKRMRHFLFMLLVINFKMGDHHLILTYTDKELPDQKTAKKNLQNFFRSMKREYKKRGVELKWICSTEFSKTGRIHHHIIINDCPDFSSLLVRYWHFGGQHSTPLYSDGNYENLANYIVKDAEKINDPGCCFKKAYSCSRNLEKPEVQCQVIKANEWRKTPKLTKAQEEEGYKIKDIFEGTDIFGYGYQKIEIEINKPVKRKKKVNKNTGDQN